MANIGNITVRRKTRRRPIPPTFAPIVKGPALVVPQTVSTVVHHARPSLMGAGNKSSRQKESAHNLGQTVIVAPGIVNRTVTYGVVGISYTQTSFTFESYTIAGAPKTKGLTENISITEPLTVQRVKIRRVFEDSPQLAELSATLTIERTKTRSLTQTDIIGEALTTLVHTNLQQTLTETDLISESLTTLKEVKRLQTETISESGDVTVRLPGVKQTLTETIEIGESILREITYGAGRIARELIQDITISDALTTRITKTRVAIEIIPVDDILAKQITTTILERTLDETVQESHTLRIERTKNRSASGTADIIDSVLGQRIAATDIIVTDEVIFAVGRGRRLTENVNIIG